MQIKLNNSDLNFIIDSEDLNTILAHSSKWYLTYHNHANKIKSIQGNSKITNKTIQLCRAVLSYYGELEVDHIDRNPLNNSKNNLRLASRAQNACNISIDRTYTTSQYRGVSWSHRMRKWKASVFKLGKSNHAGYFESEIEAAKAVDRLRLKLQGEFGVYNFKN